LYVEKDEEKFIDMKLFNPCLKNPVKYRQQKAEIAVYLTVVHGMAVTEFK
jgi:hypothetical protein